MICKWRNQSFAFAIGFICIYKRRKCVVFKRSVDSCRQFLHITVSQVLKLFSLRIISSVIDSGKCCCKPQVKMFTESFDIIFKGNGTPALALTQGVTSRAPANVKCNGNVYGYSMVTDVTITATFPG